MRAVGIPLLIGDLGAEDGAFMEPSVIERASTGRAREDATERPRRSSAPMIF
jgi:hypothetical protein